MSFWGIFALILSVAAVVSVAILFIVKKMSKRKIYIFRTEDGEEIPLGI
jgi:hypothetical protein